MMLRMLLYITTVIYNGSDIILAYNLYITYVIYITLLLIEVTLTEVVNSGNNITVRLWYISCA